MLSDVRVLDVTGDRGEIAGHLLAQHGADVVEIEPPGGSPGRRTLPVVAVGGRTESAWSLAYGRGKRSVVLDLTDEADRARFVDLVRTADVLLESWSNATRSGLGLTPERTAETNPRLVHATVSPFGGDGPKQDWAATDLVVMASASPLAVTGDRDRPPVRMSLPQAFSFAGAAAAGAVLVALYERERSGRGQHVDVSAQQAAALAGQTAMLAEAVRAPVSVRSAGGASVGRMSLRFLYPAVDGHVSITHVFGAVGGPATTRLMAWVCEAGFCDEATRDKDWLHYAELVDSGEEPVDEWERVKAAVAVFTASRTKAELLDGAIERRLLMAPVADLRDVLDSPHLAYRRVFESLDEPASALVPGPYARFSGWSPPPLAPSRPVGADQAAVLGGPGAVIDVPPVEGPDHAPALDGLKVLDLTWSVAGPALTRVLADHGATVVKVESVRRLDAARAFMPFWDNTVGVENSALFDNLNAGKLGLALDLSGEAGRAVLDDLLRWADVVVDSFSPRGRSALGLDDERVRSINPTILNMSVTLFGLDGPLAVLAGYGNLGAAPAGCYDITGWPDRAPAGPYLAYTDYTSAHLMLVTLMAALLDRRAPAPAGSSS